MKFSVIAATAAVIAQVSAVTIVTPWGSTVWSAGGHGLISWNTTASDAGLKCDIYMLNGEYTNSNIVAQITDPSTPVDCSVGQYDMYPLNDFASGQYWIRIGQSATGNWAYSAPFQFNGTGAAKPVSVVGASAAASTALPSGTAGAAIAAASASAASIASKPVSAAASAASSVAKSASSAAASASTTAHSGAVSQTVNGAALALGAIAAIALTL